MKSSALKAKPCIKSTRSAWDVHCVGDGGCRFASALWNSGFFFLVWLSCGKKSINHPQHFSNYPLFRFNLSKLEPRSKSKSETAVLLFWASWHLVISNTIKYKWNFLLLQWCFHCRQGQVCTQMTTGTCQSPPVTIYCWDLHRQWVSDGLGSVSPTDCRYIRIWLMFIRQLKSVLERHRNFQGCFTQVSVWIQFHLKSARRNIFVGTAISSTASTAELQHSAGCGRKH